MPPFSADFRNFIFKEGEDCPELTPSREVKAGLHPLTRSVRLCMWIRWPCLLQMNVHGTQGLWHSFSGWVGWKWDINLSYWEKRAKKKPKKKKLSLLFLPGKSPKCLTQKSSRLCASLWPWKISSPFCNILWRPHFPLVWLPLSFWNGWLETKVILALSVWSWGSHSEFSSRWVLERVWQQALGWGRSIGGGVKRWQVPHLGQVPHLSESQSHQVQRGRQTEQAPNYQIG